MNNTPRLYLPNMGKHRKFVGIIILAIYASAWLTDAYYLYLERNQHPEESLPGTRMLEIGIGLVLGAMSWYLGKLLADAQRVLPAVQAPQSLRNAWRHAVMRNLWLNWGLAVTAGSAVIFMKDNNATWSSALFLYSTIVSLSIAAAMSRCGALHRSCAWTIFFGTCLLLCIGGTDSYAYLCHIPVYWQLPLAAIWPLLALLLNNTKHKPPAKLATGISAKKYAIMSSLNRKRYVLLDKGTPLASSRQGFLWWIPLNSLFTISDKYMNHAWGSGGGVFNILIIIAFTICAGNTLYCRDLHWRRLLMPKGFGNGNIGWHLFVSTLVTYIWILLPLLLTVLVLARYFSNTLPQSIIAHVLQYSSMLFELLFAVSAAIALRCITHWWRISLITFAVIIISILCLRAVGGTQTQAWFTIGPAYAATLSAASLLMLLIANRIWTIKHLMHFAVRGEKEQDITIPIGRWFPGWGGARW